VNDCAGLCTNTYEGNRVDAIFVLAYVPSLFSRQLGGFADELKQVFSQTVPLERFQCEIVDQVQVFVMPSRSLTQPNKKTL
jgi:hypothetical protein